MQIDLFICTAEHNRVNKSGFLTNRFTMAGTLKKSTSVTNIVIEVEKTNPVIYHYNYMYISEFDRYYFITDITNVSRNHWIINATVDVLFSFKNDILNTEGVIEKTENESVANLYFDDGSYVLDSRKYNEIKEFPSGLNNDGQYILICAGGT